MCTPYIRACRCAVQSTKLSQSAAARAAGVSRTTIWRALKDGTLSAERTKDGSLCIDASELLRLYPRADLARVRAAAPSEPVNAHEHARAPESSGEVQALRFLIDELKASQSTQRDEIGFLRSELSRAREERERLLSMLEAKDRLLTDQRERTASRRWWQRWRRGDRSEAS